MKTNIGELFSRRAAISPAVEAYVEPASDLRLTYKELNAWSNRCAGVLGDLNVQKGDRVGLLLKNSVEFVALFYAAAKLGAVVVPLNTRLAADEVAFIVADCSVAVLVYSEEFAALAADIRANTEHSVSIQQWVQAGDGAPADWSQSLSHKLEGQSEQEPNVAAFCDDNLFIMYTSGTTGLPKGVVHSHDTVFWAALTWMATMDVHYRDRLLLPLPMFHVAALITVVLAPHRGMTVVCMPNFNPSEAWQLIESERITVAGAVPAMLNFMRQVPEFESSDRSSLRTFITGAAPLPVALIELYNAQGIEVVQGYSLTETAGGGCFLANDDAMNKLGSTGKAMLYTEVRVVDEEGNDAAVGETGEVLFRAPHLMKEYWNRPDATAETIVDGWLRTGDIALIDEDGFLFIKDRIKDMIISGGENVYPAEIENALMSHPAVAEAAVIGQHSEKWGESPFAIVVVKETALNEQELLAHCGQKLSRFKQPKGVAFVDAIPRNPSGKILKRVLREQFPGPAAE